MVNDYPLPFRFWLIDACYQLPAASYPLLFDVNSERGYNDHTFASFV